MADALNTDNKADEATAAAVPNAVPNIEGSAGPEEAVTRKDIEKNVDKHPFTFQDNDPNTLDSGAPIPVAIDYVDRQLVELWRDVAESAQAMGGSQAVTTAQVLNLVVRAASYEAANDYMRSIECITGKHPCRVIVATTDPGEDDMPVQAWVSIHCQSPPTGGRQVCCEQVSVAASGESARRLPAAIIPLLLADLPVFLWWPNGDPFDEYIFRNLIDSLNRLIIDSATFENPEGTLAKMSHQMRSQWGKIAVTDMNWGRLTPWREMVASFFDAQVMRPYLDHIGHVQIDYALPTGRGAHVNRTQALLLAGWLASRLGWEPADDVYHLTHSETSRVPSAHLTLRFGKRPVTIDLNAVAFESTNPGEIHSITLEVAGAQQGDPPAARFCVALNDDQESCAFTEVDLQGSIPTTRTIQLQPLDQSDVLDEELEVYSHDTVYEDALAMAGAFIRGSKHSAKSTGMSPKVTGGEPISVAQLQQPRKPRDGRSR